MSFAFDWDSFTRRESLHTQVKNLLTNALNTKKPRILEDQIKVLDLNWGSKPPLIEMLEIGDVAIDRFRGVFKISYTGDASITLATHVQANLLNVYTNSTLCSFVTPRIVGAAAPLPIPLHLTLKSIKLQGTVIVVFSKSKGLTLVFRNDPLTSIEVKSSFDELPGVATFLQQQIENQIRVLFREEVPAVLYQLSLKMMPGYDDKNRLDSNGRRYHNNPNREQISIFQVDPEKPVSLVNILKIDGLHRSRRNLSLRVPAIPNVINRSQLYEHSEIQRVNSPQPYCKISDNSTDGLDMIYARARIAGSKIASQKRPKRRVIKLRKLKPKDHDFETETEGEADAESELPTESETELELFKSTSSLDNHQYQPDPVIVGSSTPRNFGGTGPIFAQQRKMPSYSRYLTNEKGPFVLPYLSHNRCPHYNDVLISHDFNDLPPAYPA